jgi:hypothetical protein
MKRHLQLIIIALCLALASCQAAPDRQESRMDRSRLNIGAYILQPYARSEAHIKDLADCGIDFVICIDNDRAALDLLDKYGVGAIVTGVVPGWWGGDGNNAGTLKDRHPLSEYEAAAAAFEDHPAIWGIDIGDEPSALDFPYYGKVMERVEELFPNQFAFLNLYPNYASVAQNTEEQALSQLGTATYEEHIEQYCQYIPADYLSYDFYYKVAGIEKDYANLKVVSDACHKNNLDMWVTVQVNSLDPEVWISENELRFQAFSALAFGASNLSWACYTAGWWSNQVVDGEGNKTEQYDKLKKVNAEVHTLAGRYMKYRNTETACVGFEGTDMLDGSGLENQPELEFGRLTGLSAGCPLVVGKMTARSGRGKALFICVADDPYSENPQKHTLRFCAKGRRVKALDGDGPIEVSRTADGCYEIPVVSNQALLLEL